MRTVYLLPEDASTNAAPQLQPVKIKVGISDGLSTEVLEGLKEGDLVASGIAPSDFRIFTWTGNPLDAPQERAADLSGMSPEALVELPPAPWSAGSMLQLISDNGVTYFYGDDVTAKHLPVYNFKKSRSDRVALGAVVVPRPVIRQVGRTGADLRIEWLAQAGRTYRVQWRSDWTQGWTDVSGEVLAMASDPPVNPNAIHGGQELRNRAVTDAFEPGSTIKTFTIAGALDRGVLSISGERRSELPPRDEKTSVHIDERFVGRFRRVVSLPEDIDPNSVSAACNDGVLHISIKRRAAAQPRRIEIQ